MVSDPKNSNFTIIKSNDKRAVQNVKGNRKKKKGKKIKQHM